MALKRGISGALAAGATVLLLAGCAKPVEADTGAAEQTASAPAVTIDHAAFSTWLQDVKAEAAAKGISQATIGRTLGKAQPVPRVIELDRFQPEYTQTFWTYIDRAANTKRIEQGRELLRKHGPLLAEIERQYGVQPRFLVAFWGLETNYGATFGGFPVIDALSTLAFDERRAKFFRSELMDALEIVDKGHIAPDRMIGSWAGAMGHLQFMPSTFRRHAVDRDGDGRADIWGSLPDVFASAANYLSAEGWKGDQTWGREVRLPPGFDLTLADQNIRKPLGEWAALGLRRADGGPLPVVEGMSASLLLPAGVRGPAFLTYDNFDTIMVWNRSLLYALAVGHLADKLVGGPDISVSAPPGERPLTRVELAEIQERLNALGIDAGTPDGMAGPKTRGAIKAFQASRGLPPDGYPSAAVLELLRSELRAG